MGNACPSSSGACTSKAAPAAKVAAKDDACDDMFGDDDMFAPEEEEEEDTKADEARAARMAAALKLKQDADSKKEKKEKAPKPVEKSLVVLDVKPWEAETDLEMVWHKIIEKQQEGLTWGVSFKLEPVAYGIKKLVLTCSIVDSLVLLDDITEYIEGLDEWVQSVNIVSMNKIS